MTSDIARRPRHAVILCHPGADSFNRAIAETYCAEAERNGQDFVLRDLYAIGFDPVLKANERPTTEGFTLSPDVENELSLLNMCDVFVLVYPIWFGSPPAMMKGYVERVMGAGLDFKAVREGTSPPLLRGKRLLSFTTSAMSEPWLNEQGQALSLRYIFDRYLAHAFGMQSDEHVHFANIIREMEPRWAQQHLYEVGQKARQTCANVADDIRKAAKADIAPADGA